MCIFGVIFIKKPLQQLSAKIGFIIVLLLVLAGCDAVKRVPDGKLLLTNNTILVNGEENEAYNINNIPYQQPNTKLPLLGAPVRLYIYNWARPNLDSILQAKLNDNEQRTLKFWSSVLSRKQLDKYIEFKLDFNDVLKNFGEEPTIISDNYSARSANRLTEYYNSKGWFNAKTTYSIQKDSLEKRGQVIYEVATGKPYFIDSLKTFIKSAAADSIYEQHKNASYIKQGAQYELLDINAETSRITDLMRNNGLFHFDQEFISFVGDSVNTDHKVNLELNIRNREIRARDSVYELPLKVHKISKVNITTDYGYALRDTEYSDSVELNDHHLYAYDKIRYKPKYLTDAVFIEPGDTYSDESRNQTLIRLSQLGTFRYPDLRFSEDPDDPEGTDLVANIMLTPLPKFNLRADFDVSTSNIQRFGIAGGGSLRIRNVFGGMETLQISGRASIGDSRTAAGSNSPELFDITEIGADVSLTIPRIFFPIRTGFIAPEMSPSTSFTTGIGIQQNIGLDKQNITGGINYKWTPSQNLNYRFDLFDIQYVRNLNVSNYFNVYENSYEELNDIALSYPTQVADYLNDNANLSIPDGALAFINAVQNNAITLTTSEFSDVINIEERRQRLTEDNLILATSFTYFKNTRENLFDDEFTSFRAKLELAGNTLSAISNLIGLEKNDDGSSRILGVTFSQYVKTELDFIKHWDFGNDNILAFRAYGGIAIPYGNSNSIPFIRSFFGGGSNDNRAWQAYRLGPGSTDSPNDFNEANMKLAFNLEQRFTFLGDLKGAIFTDVGNIWNALDNVDDPQATFSGFSSLKDIAVGTGFGLRYDFSFFVLRFDVGFKTYDPALEAGERWFKNTNFPNAVYNVGINYPF